MATYPIGVHWNICTDLLPQLMSSSADAGCDYVWRQACSVQAGGIANRSATVSPPSNNNSLEPLWQKKQSSKPRLLSKDHTDPGRVFHRRRVLEIPEPHGPVELDAIPIGKAKKLSGRGVFARNNQDAGATDNNFTNVKQRREMERSARQRAAQLIQSHFRGFKARKFVECVRRKLAAERKRDEQQLQAHQDSSSSRKKLVRPALKTYHGF